MGKLKQVNPLAGINRKVATWKDAHMAEVVAKLDNEAAREDVKATMLAAGTNHVNTPSGPIALQHREGGVTTDWQAKAAAWEAFARKHLDEKLLESDAPKASLFQSTSASSVVLAALPAWGVEAKAARKARDA